MPNTIISITTGLIIVLLISALSQSYIPSKRKVVNSTCYQYLPKRVQWAYSLVYLKTLAVLEEEIYQLMKNCTVTIKGEHHLLDNMHSWMKKYENTTRRATGPIPKNIGKEEMKEILTEAVISNPLLTFKMMHRFTKDLTEVLFPLPKNTDVICGSIPLLKHVTSIYKEFVLPIRSDLGKVISNILRISWTYNLSAISIINGELGKLQTDGLNEIQVLDIAEHAVSMGLNMQALEWYYAGFQFSTDPNITAKFLFGIETMMAKRSDYHDKGILRKSKMRNTQTSRYVNIIYTNVMSKYLEYLEKPDAVNDAFQRLCKGTFPEVHYQNPELFCWYEKEVHPVWRLVPLKLELLNQEIGLTLVHDAFGGKFAKKIIKDASAALLAEPDTQEAKASTQAETEMNPGVKHSKNAWTRTTPDLETAKDWAASVAALKDNIPLVVELNKKIERITGLIVDNTDIKKPYKASDDLHINSYTFGGHHHLHFDETADENEDAVNGNLMTTFMIYLNEVQQGGNTAFPHYGIKVTPKKGSALFWNNLMKNGNLNPKTQHGGCTIMSGTKWGSTTWIHSNENFLRRKCAMDQLE